MFSVVDLRIELVIMSASSSAIVGFFPDYVISLLVYSTIANSNS